MRLLFLCVCALAALALVSAGEEKSTADVIGTEADIDKLSDKALKELFAAADPEVGIPYHVKAEKDFDASKAKGALKALHKLAKPAFDAFFENYKELMEKNKGLISSIAVSPKRTKVNPDQFDHSAFFVTMAAIDEKASTQLQWGKVPKELQQVELAPVAVVKNFLTPKAFDKLMSWAQQAIKGQKASVPAAKSLIPMQSPMAQAIAVRFGAARVRFASIDSRAGGRVRARVPGANDVYTGTELGGTGTSGFLITHGGQHYVATNGHVCDAIGVAGTATTADDMGGTARNVGNIVASSVSLSVDTCVVGPVPGGTATSCENRDGLWPLDTLTLVPNFLSGLNMLIGRRITQFGSQPKGGGVQRTFAKIRYWGLMLPPVNYNGHWSHVLGVYIALKYDPNTWIDNRGAESFAVPGDSGTGVSSFPRWGTGAVVAQTFGGAIQAVQNVWFERFYSFPIHKHVDQWSAQLGGGAVALC